MENYQRLATFSNTSRPRGKRPLGCTFVFTVQQKMDQSLKFKARLVAQGFTPRPGIDFGQSFAPTASEIAVFLVDIIIAVAMGWAIRQDDIKCAYHNADINAKLYMQSPPGFKEFCGNEFRAAQSGGGRPALRPNKALYKIL